MSDSLKDALPKPEPAIPPPTAMPTVCEGGDVVDTPPDATDTARSAGPQRFCGKPGRSGPPKGNANALRHGMSGGKLPPGCQYIENRVNSLRRQVEAALIEAKDEIGIVDAAAVNSVLKWERHGLLAAHWLRHEAERLTPTERLKFSEAIAKASDARDRAIRSLGLDRDTADNVLDALYSRATPSTPETEENE